jgi:2-desacetyl-2-hydroxyethyl bacteriochlorophyllide A dehydrogenase
MKQVVLEAPGRFSDQDAPRPDVKPGYALVRIARVGICGSDLHAFAGRQPLYTYPRIVGHELSGVVIEAAPNAKGIRAGDRCAIEPYVSCGSCRACSKGRTNCCEHLQVLGVHIDGGMQEFLAVPVNLLYTSNTLTLDQLALVETLGIGAHAVRRSGLKAGEDAFVIGAGPIGIATAQFASASGANVLVVEKSASRRAFIAQLGFATSSEVEERKADVVFDATGNAISMAASLNYVATGGALVFVGLTRDPVSLDDALFHRKEVTLFSSRNSCGLFPDIIHLIEEGKIDTTHWITNRLKLTEVASNFASITSRPELIKAMVDISD